MPRKTSQAAAKDTSVAEGSAPRRSGRAATKQEPVGKDTNRSRRSSTAAQTAASVADSKSPKGRTSGSRRDSTSPSDGRSRSNVEYPAPRVKSTRRNASRINYKESDGEEEVATPKFDDNFVSGEEFDDSESDEKSKRGRGKSKPAPKASSSKDKKKATGRSRRGRTKKEVEEEEEEEELEAQEDGADLEETPTKRGRAAKAREPPKSSRGRGQKADTAEDKTLESKPSRRSSRGASSKEEATPRKRPSRGVQAKHYTEEEEEDVAELSDSKAEGEEENTKKRKREDSPEESSKRAKEDKEEPSEEADSKKAEGGEEGSKMEDEKEPEEKPAEEPMEVDETDSSKVSNTPSKSENKDTKVDDTLDSEMKEDSVKEPSAELSEKKESETSAPAESNTVSNVSAPGLKSEQASKPVESCKPKDVNESADVAKTDDSKPVSDVSAEKPEGISKPASVPEPMVAQSSVVDSKTVTASVPDKSEKVVPTKPEENSNSPRKSELEKEKQNNASEGSKAAVGSSTAESSIPTTQSKETPDASLNGEEKDAVSKPASSEIHSNATLNSESPDKSIPKANGAHNDVQHTKSSPTKDQYYSLPGRKYVINSKLSESLKQSIKNQTFGFVSYNLGTLGPDAYIQKEKLLNEINSLDAHLICLQQVAKPFYSSVIEPSLDALGFKSVFSQPENSLKGMATFYKSSLFRLSGQSEISLKQLIEKDIEASPLDPADRAAVKNHIRKCGNVLFSHLSSVLGSHAITIANVQIPPTDLSIHALQVSCLAKEVIKMNGGSNKPLLIGGEFNIAENDASYQLLKDGYLSNEMIEDLQKRKDVVLPEKENASLVNLLWKSFQHPSSNLCSCYTSVLGHEFVIPELKTTSPDLIWFSSDSLCTVGVLDAESGKPGDHRFSLKADVAFNA